MKRRFVICVDNERYCVALEKRKLYEMLADPEAEQAGQLRVKNESEEDYLYPKELFVDVELRAAGGLPVKTSREQPAPRSVAPRRHRRG